MYRFVTYNRVSTDQQGHGTSLDWQREAQVEHGKKLGWHHVEDIFDRGQSGAKLERQGVARAMELLGAGDANMVSIYKVDRAARTQRVFEDFWAGIFAVGGKVFLHDKNKIYETLHDLMADTVLDRAMAEHERDSIQRRSDDGMREHMKRGSYTFRLPFGYFKRKERIDGFNFNQVVIDNEQARVVQLIFQMLAERHTLSEVARTLNDRGYQSPRRKQWSISMIRSITRNRHKYTGLPFKKSRKIGGKKFEDIYELPAIISTELLQRYEEEHNTRAAYGEVSPFRKAVYCSNCGRQAHRTSAAQKEGFARVIIGCKSRTEAIRRRSEGRELHGDVCEHSISGSVLARHLADWLRAGGYHDEFRRSQTRLVTYDAMDVVWETRLGVLRERHDTMTRRMLRMPEAQFETLRETFEQELRAVNEEIDQLRDRKQQHQTLRSSLRDALTRFGVPTPTLTEEATVKELLEALSGSPVDQVVEGLIAATENDQIEKTNRLLHRLGIRILADFSVGGKGYKARWNTIEFRVDLPTLPSQPGYDSYVVEMH